METVSSLYLLSPTYCFSRDIHEVFQTGERLDRRHLSKCQVRNSPLPHNHSRLMAAPSLMWFRHVCSQKLAQKGHLVIIIDLNVSLEPGNSDSTALAPGAAGGELNNFVSCRMGPWTLYPCSWFPKFSKASHTFSCYSSHHSLHSLQCLDLSEPAVSGLRTQTVCPTTLTLSRSQPSPPYTNPAEHHYTLPLLPGALRRW